MDSSATQVVTFQNHHGNTKTNESQQNHPPSNNHGGWRAAIFIIFVEIAERFTFYGLSGNLITFITKELNQSTPTAAKNVNTWLGITSFCPFLGAFIADSFLGRFRTILISSIIYCMGMALLAVSVSLVPRRRWYGKAVFFTALFVVSIGEGGHKPCLQTFAADQFGEETEEEKKAKSSFFNWWYFALVLGASAATFAVIYVQDNIGWAAGFEILAGGIGAALVLFLLGTRRYKKQGPLGSPFTAIAQVFVAATRKWNLNIVGHNPADHPYFGIYYGDHDHSNILKPRTLPPTNQFRFLDKARMIDKIDASNKIRNPWRLCSINQVEEVKLVLRLIPIWMTCIMLLVVQSLFNTYFTIQGRTMIRSIGPNFKLPPASLQIFAGFTIILTIPIYDRVFVPLARKLTGKPSGITVLQRIGAGLFMSLVNMVVSALVEAKRLSVAREHKLVDNPKAVVVPMKVWWLLPQYVLCGFSDALSFVGIQELFYNEMPESLRSLGAAAYVSIAGVANFISSAIISVVQGLSSNHGHNSWLDDNLNRAHLDYYYWIMAGLSALNLCAYVWMAKRFVYKKVDQEDGIEEGKTIN
ncbi:protein NRT1/ PTR FAMILY 5.4-like [Ziziphus jujuba]|uniref:Protein NRT1/ PTR FAMILY 5.4-like n=1 Tax=Ziziphus jujuba TaxID=326968 RepID=A0A6P3YW48_ZIZJJ|nr:protein NRT1/ PTR FAMILY 5.4-like [Ziziphus jujuba]